MLIDHLRLARFRGIRNELELDLTAPLTVLYAVNGTGKTTVCDGVEWLVTGSVRRLTPGAALTNWYVDDEQDPCCVEVMGSGLEFKRSEGSGLRSMGARGWRNCDTADLLRQLTGNRVPGGSTRDRNSRMREWTKATWFLDGEHLSHLVDSDSQAREARDTIFASLFGVADLGSERKRLVDVSTKMNAPWLDADKTELEARLAALSEPDGGDVHEEAVRRTLVEAERVLGVSATGGLSIPRVQVARMELGVRLADHDRCLEALDTVRRLQPGEGEVRVRLAEIDRHLSALAEMDCDSRARIQGLEVAVARGTTEAASHARTLADLDTVATEVTEMRRSTLPSQLAVDAPNPLPAAEAELRRGAFILEAWTEADAMLEAAADQRTRRSTHRTRLDQLRVLASEMAPAGELDAAVQRLDLERARLRAQVERLSGPLDNLRVEAQQLLTGLTDAHHCPLCGHDHLAAECLRQAILDAQNADPVALSDLLAQAAAIDQEREAVQRSSDTRRSVDCEIAEENRRLRVADDEIEASRARLAELGLSQDLLDSDERGPMVRVGLSAAQHRHDEVNRRVTELRDEADFRQRILAVARKLAEIDEVAGLTLAPALSEPGVWLASAADAFQSRRGVLLELIEEAQVRQRAASAEKQRVEDELEIRIAERAGLEDERTHHQAAMTELDLARTALTECDRAIDLEEEDSRLANSGRALQVLAEQLDEVEAQIPQIEAQLMRSTLARSLAQAQATSMVRQRWKDDIDRGVQALDEARRQRIAAQLDPLRRQIWALYSHVVLTSIDIKPGPTGGLDWLPKMFDQEVPEPTHLSRGQRLDLALSIFLARALSVGGSFFLDEPVLHLDDLNRVGVLDILRVIAQSHGDRVRMVLTTADRGFVRHLREKFSLLAADPDRGPLLRLLTLTGNPKVGVRCQVEEIARAPEHDAISLLPTRV